MKTPLLKSNNNENENENENEMVILNVVENTLLSEALMSKRAQFLAAARESVSFDLNRNSTCNYQTIVNTSGGISSPTSSNGANNTILNSTPSAILCRICYTADTNKEPLLQPCNCSGTMGVMHKTCLEKWLAQCNKNHCEICNFEFNVQRVARPFDQWLFRPISTKDNKNLLNDLVCFLILTPLAFVSTWYCVVFAFKFNESENRWESSGLVVLTTFLLVIYVLWLIFSCRYHHRVFKEWQQKNQIVILNIEEEKAIDSMMLLNQSQTKNNTNNENNKVNQAYNQSLNNSDEIDSNTNSNNHDAFNVDLKVSNSNNNATSSCSNNATNESRVVEA